MGWLRLLLHQLRVWMPSLCGLRGHGGSAALRATKKRHHERDDRGWQESGYYLSDDLANKWQATATERRCSGEVLENKKSSGTRSSPLPMTRQDNRAVLAKGCS
ncbi:hypothetical protein EDD17DRAFT_1193394 [Pisolithus thermaeus]|nr:hypothetical protein EDD17DRAFT_1193394 [Pisolithus thermaeus]